MQLTRPRETLRVDLDTDDVRRREIAPQREHLLARRATIRQEPQRFAVTESFTTGREQDRIAVHPCERRGLLHRLAKAKLQERRRPERIVAKERENRRH